MEQIIDYLFQTKNEQIVFSQIYCPNDKDSFKSERDYKKVVEAWEKSFINVLNARPCSGKESETDILIRNSKKDASLIAAYGNKCLVSLKKKGVLVLCLKKWGS